jgi:hypothetical protein
MSLTYGYNLEKGDDMIAAPVQSTEIVARLVLPGAALVNSFPFCAVTYSASTVRPPHNYSQCSTFLHGSHGSATNHWHG